MANIKSKIENHNKKLITKKQTKSNKECNYRDAKKCPLNQQCLQSSAVYQAKVTRLDCNKTESYMEMCETDFKIRYRNHKTSINHSDKTKHNGTQQVYMDTERQSIDYKLDWTILKHAKSYSNITKKCNLCLAEKCIIINNPELSSLNKRTEIVSSCLHSKIFLLCSFRPQAKERTNQRTRREKSPS